MERVANNLTAAVVSQKKFSAISAFHILYVSNENLFFTPEVFTPYQGFNQAILMPGGRHKKLNLLTECSKSIFIKFYFKACRHLTCSQNKLAYKVSSISNYLSSRCKKTKIF